MSEMVSIVTCTTVDSPSRTRSSRVNFCSVRAPGLVLKKKKSLLTKRTSDHKMEVGYIEKMFTLLTSKNVLLVIQRSYTWKSLTKQKCLFKREDGSVTSKGVC